MCVFCEIIKGNIPSSCVYEDEDVKVIKDLNPQAPVHLLLIPKEHYEDVTQLNASRAATLGMAIQTIGAHQSEWGLEGGFRIVSNVGDNGCQSVHHLHIHILGGAKLSERMA